MRNLSLIAILLAASMGAHAADLSIHFSGVTGKTGTIMVAVFDSEAAYKAKESFRKAKVPADGPHQTLFKDLPAGQYAVTVYYDENDNGKMDKNFMGIPSEAYGFSKNPGARFGPPEFSAAAVTLKDNLAIDIMLE